MQYTTKHGLLFGLFMVSTVALSGCSQDTPSDAAAEAPGEAAPDAAAAAPSEVPAQAADTSSELFDDVAPGVLAGMNATLDNARSLQFKAQVVYDEIEPSGVKVKRTEYQEVTIQRPNKLHTVVVEGNGTVRESWYDGATFTIARPLEGVYAQLEIAVGIDELLEVLGDDYDLNLPTVDLLYSDADTFFEHNLISAHHVGSVSFNDRTLDQISLETTGGDIQFWVSQDAPTLPRRMVIDFVTVEGSPEYMAMFTDWTIDGDAVIDAFEADDGWNQVILRKVSSEAE